jgi:hypothetical protein
MVQSRQWPEKWWNTVDSKWQSVREKPWLLQGRSAAVAWKNPRHHYHRSQ